MHSSAAHPFFQVLVDRVRAGVVPSWLPRRLGGGLGQRQKGTQRFAWKVRFYRSAYPGTGSMNMYSKNPHIRTQ